MLICKYLYRVLSTNTKCEFTLEALYFHIAQHLSFSLRKKAFSLFIWGSSFNFYLSNFISPFNFNWQKIVRRGKNVKEDPESSLFPSEWSSLLTVCVEQNMEVPYFVDNEPLQNFRSDMKEYLVQSTVEHWKLEFTFARCQTCA